MEYFDPHPLINVPLRFWNPHVPLHPFSRADDDREGGTQVLDAIASACVSEARGQVVAITLTFSKADDLVTLCIAQNDEISHKTLTFMKTVWEDMKLLSNQHRANNLSTEDTDNFTYSPEVIQTISEIFKRCYGHGILKFKRRLMKRWDGFVKFRRFWRNVRSGEDDLRDHLGSVANVLKSVVDIIDVDQEMTLTEITKVKNIMSAGWRHFKVLRHKPDELQAWTDEYKHGMTLLFTWIMKSLNYLWVDALATNEEFPLHRYLKKCYSLHGFALNLCGFALSHRLSPVIDWRLQIEPLSPEGEDLTLPEDYSRWESYLGNVFEQASLDNKRKDALRNAAYSAVQFQQKNHRHRAPVHCVCLLLAHHHRQLRNTRTAAITPPLDYIGCSKPPCYACQQYFDAYNDVSNNNNDHPIHFYTRESHFKVYPWAMPSLGDSTDFLVTNGMSRMLCHDYAAYLTATGQANAI